MTTSSEVAEFVLSEEGKLWLRYCRHYGITPGSVFSDDVIAFQVGIGYMMREAAESEPEESSFTDLPKVVWG